MAAFIKSFELHEGREAVDGLRPLKLTHLGDVTILAGKNGSGKTRILNALRDAIKRGRTLSSEDTTHEGDYKIFVNNLKNQIRSSIEQLQEDGSTHDRGILEQTLSELRSDLARNASIEFALGVSPSTLNVINLLPETHFDFTDPDTLSKADIGKIKQSHNNVFTNENRTRETLIRIAVASHEYMVANNPKSGISDKEKENAISKFVRMRTDVDKIVGALLSHNERLDPILDEKTLAVGAGRLSNGQKRLLDFSTINDMDGSYSDSTLLLLDEPELFIHPAALSMIIDRLLDLFPNMQMMLATHSVPLIAHMGFDKVWWVEDGAATYAGKKVGDVLENLLGGHDNIGRLQELTLEPARMAAVTFACQCLLPPSVVAGEGPDPQTNQISVILTEMSTQIKEPLRVLDWGAGKCRLLACLNDESGGKNESQFEYVGYEPNQQHNSRAAAVIERIYRDASKRFFNTISSLSDAFGEGSFNVVILCNVLHEVSPMLWQELFDHVRKFLKESGYLVVVEDNHIPSGELAHAEGFIISDGRALQRLFGLDDMPINVTPSDERYHDRLFAYMIPCSQVRCTGDTVRGALTWTRDQSLQKIREIRERGTTSYTDGTLHGLYAMQYVNSSMALVRV